MLLRLNGNLSCFEFVCNVKQLVYSMRYTNLYVNLIQQSYDQEYLDSHICMCKDSVRHTETEGNTNMYITYRSRYTKVTFHTVPDYKM